MLWYFCFLQQSGAQKFWARTIDGLTMLQFQTALWAWEQTESCVGVLPQPFSSSLLLKRFHMHSYQHRVLRFWGHSYQYCALKPQESWAVCFSSPSPSPQNPTTTAASQNHHEKILINLLFLSLQCGRTSFLFPFPVVKVALKIVRQGFSIGKCFRI